MWRDEVDRVLADDYLGDLSARSLDEIRAMRDECRTVENKVSFLRRMIQGRLDIVAADLRRRSEGGSAVDLGALIEQLPDILSDKGHPGGPGRLPSGVLPPDDEDLTAELDRVAGADALARLPELAGDEVSELARAIGELEREVSARRKDLFGRIDTLHQELVRRYKTGEADAGALLER